MMLLKPHWSGYELMAALQGAGFFWELWKKEGKSTTYQLTKGFPGSRLIVKRGYFDEVVYDYKNFLENEVKQHPKEK